MGRITSLLATLILLGCAATVSHPVLISHESERNMGDVVANVLQRMLEKEAKEDFSKGGLKAKYLAWDLYCYELRDVSCEGIKLPKVYTFRPNPARPGLQGYYDGSDKIYIRNDLRGDQRLETLAHEMSHYWDQNKGLLPPLPVYNDDKEGILKLCFSEKWAWAVSDEYNRRYGNPKDVVGSKWTQWYRHCTPFKDELYGEN